MGTAANILILMTILNVGIIFFGFDSGATTLFKFLNIDEDTGQMAVNDELQTQLLAMVGINLGAAVVTSLVLYAGGLGQYSIFAAIVTWMMGFAFLPLTLLTRPEIPNMIKVVIAAPLFMMYILSLIGFFRGVDL